MFIQTNKVLFIKINNNCAKYEVDKKEIAIAKSV